MADQELHVFTGSTEWVYGGVDRLEASSKAVVCGPSSVVVHVYNRAMDVDTLTSTAVLMPRL